MRDPKLHEHPLLLNPDYAEKCFPGKVHSDSVVMTNKQSLHIISCSSFLGFGDALDTQLYFGSAAKSICCNEAEHGVSTMNVLWRMFAWSLSACVNGRHPILDWQHKAWLPGSREAKAANKPLTPQGWVFAIVGICADLDELCNEYRLAHFNSNKPCFWCPCNTTDMPWSDFSEEALFLRHLYGPDGEGHGEQLIPGHPIWEIPGVTRFSVLWDILHGLDLGPTLHVTANVILDLAEDERLGENRTSGLGVVWAGVQKYYKTLGVANTLSNLTLSMITEPNSVNTVFPRLHAKGE